MNHFKDQCQTRPRVNVLETDSGSEDEDGDDYYLYVLDGDENDEVINSTSDRKHAKKVFARLEVNKKLVKFQIVSGATCNVIPASLITDKGKISATTKVLTMYNQTTVTPMGQCTVKVGNPKNRKEYEVEFVVVNGDGCTPIFGNSTIQDMELVQIQYHNILSMEAKPPTQEALLKEYPDVFQRTGKLEGHTNSKSSKMSNQ